ncbi:hypothetical protein C5167_018583 [Papaver somniferum]|uniref:6-phosphogluconate dehydrogenase NADP-binding domain-containing protein n=1 Tax=Papaver somniferum TaxID=3469 RepID=A0A4Y7INA3_PAPSO|nr:hypothetical protein C5167_018583 [Papaver somniferum]
MGAQFASSPLSVASSSDTAFSTVGYPSDVRSVLIGSSGALNSLGPGGILFDMTTSDPSLAVEIASAASAKGLFLVVTVVRKMEH